MGGHSDNSLDVQMSIGPKKDCPVVLSVQTLGLDIRRRLVQGVREANQYSPAGG